MMNENEYFENMLATGILYAAYNRSSVAWAPTDITGVTHWWEADLITGLSDADDVSQWDDAAGSDNLVQAVVAAKPHYKTGILNGKPIVRGTKDASKLSTASLSHGIGVGDFTWAFVGMNTNVNDGYRCFIANGANAPGIFVHDNRWDFYWGASNLLTSVPVNSTYYVIVAVRASGTLTFYIDGTPDATTPDLSAGNMANGAFHAFWGGAGHIMSGDIAAILTCDRAISDGDRDALEAYWGSKYGITVA